MEEPDKKPMLKSAGVSISEMIRQKVGLVNNIQPPKPQPKKTNRTTVKQGGSKARKILKGQR